MSERYTSHLNPVEFKRIKGSLALKLLKRGDEGGNHWSELYEIADKRFLCSEGCGKPATFLIYTHYHQNDEDVSLVCYDDASPFYKSLLDSVSAA